MKTTLILALLCTFSTTVFCQSKEAPNGTTPADLIAVSADDDAFAPMSYAAFKEAEIISNDQLGIFETMDTKTVTQCAKAPKNGACYLATTTKYSTCEDFEKLVQQGKLDFKSMSYGGCAKTDDGLTITVVEEELKPVKAGLMQE